MAGKPQISVVMGVYNDARHVGDALGSILRQEQVDLEFIVVDDGSTDATADVLESHAREDPRVRIVRQSNRGLTRSLITACAEAAGDLVARQDSDDVSLPGRLVALRDLLLADPGLALASSWAEWIGPEDELLFVDRRPEDTVRATQALMHERVGPPAHGTVMFRRADYEQAGGYRPEFRYAQDADLWHRLGAVGRIGYVPEVLYRYRFHPGSISGARARVQRYYGDVEQECLRRRLAGEEDADVLRGISEPRERRHPFDRPRADASFFIGRCLASRGDPRCRRYLGQAARTAPWNARYWAAWLAGPRAGPAGEGE